MEEKKTKMPKGIKTGLLVCGGAILIFAIYCAFCFGNYTRTRIDLLDRIMAGFACKTGEYDVAYSIFRDLDDYARADECVLQAIRDAETGDSIFFGKYKQGTNSKNSAKPIRWVVLEKTEENVLLITKDVLQVRKFGGTTWEACELRKWLNDEFYASAFSTHEKSIIQEMITSKSTTDNVFCLSQAEADKLLPKNGYETAKSEIVEWWMRSFYSSDQRIAVLEQYYKSWYPSSAWPEESDIGVRPAICVTISGEADGTAKNMSIFGCDSQVDLDLSDRKTSSKSPNSSSNYSGSSANKKCTMCNGTGSAKYYYGESDLEALLTGHNTYEWGPCPMCGGTGKSGG